MLVSIAGFAQKSPQKMQQQRQAIQSDPKVEAVEMSEKRGTPNSIRFDRGYQVRDTRQVFQKHLQMKPADKLEFTKNARHADGISVARYQQFYKGIPVAHGQFTALAKDDQLAAVSGEFYELENTNISPSLSEAQALEAAKNFIGATQYVWEYIAGFDNGVWSQRVLDQIEQAYKDNFPKGELVIVDDFRTPETDLDLAWKFNIYANEPLSRDWVYVNAHTGKIMLRDAIIKHTTTSVSTRYGGIQEIGTTLVLGANPSPEYAGDEDYYILFDQERGGGIQTYDMNGIGGAPVSVPLLYTAAADFVDDDNIWTSVEHVRDPAPTIEEAINDDIAWDAHWGASMVYDYWLERHGRLSYDDADAKINSYVHYGEGYDNAFWNGSAMTYGDGSYKNFGVTQVNGFAPLTSLDVCGHEIGHAVCEHTANLVYEKESGAMNEAFSDIWAACMEHYVIERFSSQSFAFQPWSIGEQIDFGTGPNDPNNALRRMDDPKLTGNPDTYGGDNWSDPDCEPDLVNDYCGVHNNSGLLNKWFYLITEGSGTSPDDGENDNGDSYSVAGLGFEVSELIAFGTEVQLTPTATYAEARAAAIAYTRAVYGPCSMQEESVTNAWYAIGVGAAFTCSGGSAATGFLVTAKNVGEAAQGDGDCNDSKAIAVQIFVNSPVNFNVVVGGTATLGRDFTLSSANVSHGSNGFAVKTITINLIDDAAAEGSETIIFNIPGGVGAVAGSDVYTLTITDDDVAPIVGIGDKSLLYERFLTSSMPTGWGVKTNIESINAWNFGGYTGRAFVSATGLLPNYEANNNPTDIILHTAQLDARGVTGVTVSFDWTAGGETDLAIGGGAPFDFGSLMYSFDGVNFQETGAIFVGDNFGATLKSGTYTADLSSLLDNRQFYLGWRWQNDPLLGNYAYSFSFDEVRVNAMTRQIETQLADAGQEYLGPNATVYYYSGNDGQLLATLKNLTSHDFGCTNLSIERAGTGAESWYNGGKSTSKSLRIQPEFNSASANVEITLYYSQAELNGYESASATLRSQLNMFQTTAGTIGGAAAGNTTEANAIHSPIFKTPATVIGGSFKATLNGSLGGVVLAKNSIGMPLITPPGSNGGLVATAEEPTVFPNPASGTATLVLPDFGEEQSVQIELINLNGQAVWKENRRTQGSEEVGLDLSGFAPGVYLVKVRTAARLFVEKLIVE